MPSSSPSFISGIVAYDAAATDGRLVELPLEEPVVLQQGQSLVLAVRMAVNVSVTESLCIASCSDAPTPGFDFWSNAAAEPYDWEDLVTGFGLGNSNVSAFGYVEP